MFNVYNADLACNNIRERVMFYIICLRYVNVFVDFQDFQIIIYVRIILLQVTQVKVPSTSNTAVFVEISVLITFCLINRF